MRKCNCCGRELLETKDDALVVMKNWGYASQKDGQRHHFVLCETCYDRMIADWRIPVEIKENTTFVDY